jgi:hypothetical protein
MDSECDNLILKILVIANGYCYEFWIYQALDHPGFEVFSSLFSFLSFLDLSGFGHSGFGFQSSVIETGCPTLLFDWIF